MMYRVFNRVLLYTPHEYVHRYLQVAVIKNAQEFIPEPEVTW